VADFPVRLHPSAEEEANNAWSWYAERSASAAAAFLVELDAAVFAISEAPSRWPRIYGRYRRFPMRTFPFSIVYAVRRDLVEVVAVAHYRRKPGYWRDRQHAL
jgi:plasmid stabilization system protein ParE